MIMSDDVASFFKSKKTKKGGAGKTASIQDPDALARRLERTVQQQQEFDRENGVDENDGEFDHHHHQSRPPYSQQLSGGGGGGAGSGGGGSGGGVGAEQNNEESEWLDVQENQDIDVAKFGIKEMEIREESEDEANEDDESLSNRKTWNIPGQPQTKQQTKAKKVPEGAAGMDIDEGVEAGSADEKPPAETNTEETEKQEGDEATDAASKTATDKEDADEPKSRYVPPSLRNKQLSAMGRPTFSYKKPNIEDSVEFPSLAAAGELEAEIEKSKKKKPPPPQQSMKKAWSPAPAPVSAPSPEPTAGVWKPKAWVPHTPAVVEPDATPEPPKPTGAPADAGPGKSSYVPPHLRKRDGAS